jgi:hypothetical protein
MKKQFLLPYALLSSSAVFTAFLSACAPVSPSFSGTAPRAASPVTESYKLPGTPRRAASPVTESYNVFASDPFEGNTFSIASMRIDNTMQPSNLFDTFADCANENTCAGIASAVGEYTGIPIGMMLALAAAVSGERRGEGTFLTMSSPSGYKYCRSSMSLTSIVPNDGPRGSTFLGRADDESMYIETWTPVLPPGQGRSWVEGNVTLISVKSESAEAEYQSGRCVRGGQRVVFYCRGSGCQGGAEDRGQALDSSSPPGAGSRK